MLLKINQFCNLATTPSWQSWLYNYNNTLYHEFINKLSRSHGCGDNKKIMINIIQKINDANDGDKLLNYVNVNHPQLIIKKQSKPKINNEIFPNYRPGMLTFPKRIIFDGLSKDKLIKRVNEFISDKLQYDYIIVNEKAYIEYLTKSDLNIQSQIPKDNWLLNKYRLT